MSMETRLRKLEQRLPPTVGRVVTFPGLSQDDAVRAAKSLIVRGEIAADDLVIGIPESPLGKPDIRHLSCTAADYCAWLDTLPE
jgi:hypothetical protein